MISTLETITDAIVLSKIELYNFFEMKEMLTLAEMLVNH